MYLSDAIYLHKAQGFTTSAQGLTWLTLAQAATVTVPVAQLLSCGPGMDFMVDWAPYVMCAAPG